MGPLVLLWSAGGPSPSVISGCLGPSGAAEGAARWSIIYYWTSLLLPCAYVTNALRRDAVPEVNAARRQTLLSPDSEQLSVRSDDLKRLRDAKTPTEFQEYVVKQL